MLRRTLLILSVVPVAILSFGGGLLYGKLGLETWVPLLVILVPTACVLYLRTWRQFVEESRRWSIHCHHCGYDLRGSPGACPECGNVPADVPD